MPKLDAITLKQLRALAAVVETGSITAAAEGLSLTPPAVHSQLKTLKESLGSEVLLRDGPSGFKLTAEGRILLGAFLKTEAALTRALEDITALRRGVAGRVVLGVVSTGKYFAPGIVARLKRAHPDIHIQLVIGNRDEIIEGLDTEQLDIAIMGRPPRQPRVVDYPVGDHRHVLIASPENTLSQLATASHDDLLRQTFILREHGSGTRILSTRFLDRIGEGRLYDTVEMGSNETIKQAVIADLGVAIISAHTVIDELVSGRLAVVRADGLPITRQWYVLHRESLHLTGAMSTILDAIRAQARTMLRTDEVEALLGP